MTPERSPVRTGEKFKNGANDKNGGLGSRSLDENPARFDRVGALRGQDQKWQRAGGIRRAAGSTK